MDEHKFSEIYADFLNRDFIKDGKTLDTFKDMYLNDSEYSGRVDKAIVRHSLWDENSDLYGGWNPESSGDLNTDGVQMMEGSTGTNENLDLQFSVNLNEKVKDYDKRIEGLSSLETEYRELSEEENPDYDYLQDLEVRINQERTDLQLMQQDIQSGMNQKRFLQGGNIGDPLGERDLSNAAEADFLVKPLYAWVNKLGGLGDFIDDFFREKHTGQVMAQSVGESMAMLRQGSSVSDKTLMKFVENYEKQKTVQQSHEVLRYHRSVEECGGSMWCAIKSMIKNPEVAPLVFVQSLSMMANKESLTAGGAIVGGAAVYGGATGAAATAYFGGAGAGAGAMAAAGASLPYAMGVMGGILETGMSFAEFIGEALEDQGLEVNDENLRKILENKEQLNKIRGRALARGIAIGVVDAFTGKLGSSVGTKVLTRSGGVATKGTKAMVFGGQTALEAVGGGSGEALAMKLAGQDLSMSEILLEATGGTVTAPASFISAMTAVPKYKIGKNTATREQMMDMIEDADIANLQDMNVSISNDPALEKMLSDRMKKNKVEKELIAVNPDRKYSGKDMEEMVELQTELNRLDGIKGVLSGKKKQQLKEKLEAKFETYEVQEQSTDAETTGRETDTSSSDVEGDVQRGTTSRKASSEKINNQKETKKLAQAIFPSGQVQNLKEVEGAVLIEEGDTKIILNDKDGSLVIDSVETKKESRGQGKARDVLERITEEADMRGIDIELNVEPQPETGTTTEGLISLYESLGFVKNKNGTGMTRSPQERVVKRVSNEQAGMSLDKYLASINQVTPDATTDNTTVNGKKVEGDYVLQANDKIDLSEGLTTEDAAMVVEDIQAAVDADASRTGITTTRDVGVQREDAYTKPERLKSLRKAVKKAANSIKKIAPNVTIEIVDNINDYLKLAGETNAKNASRAVFRKNDNGGRTIYLNAEKAGSRTVAHEVFHAILKTKLVTDAEIARVTKEMVKRLKGHVDADTQAWLDEFTDAYKGDQAAFRNEEEVSEFFGVLAEAYADMPEQGKGIIHQWIAKVAKMLGLNKPSGNTEVHQLLHSLSQKVATGKTITNQDFKGSIFEDTSTVEMTPSQENEVVRKQKSLTDKNKAVAKIIEDKVVLGTDVPTWRKSGKVDGVMQIVAETEITQETLLEVSPTSYTNTVTTLAQYDQFSVNLFDDLMALIDGEPTSVKDKFTADILKELKDRIKTFKNGKQYKGVAKSNMTNTFKRLSKKKKELARSNQIKMAEVLANFDKALKEKTLEGIHKVLLELKHAPQRNAMIAGLFLNKEIRTKNVFVLDRKGNKVTEIKDKSKNDTKSNRRNKKKDIRVLVNMEAVDKKKRAAPLYEKMKATVVENLIRVYNSVSPEVRAISKLWYDGANLIAQRFAEEYGVTLDQAAAVIATQSPQKPWFDNLHLGQAIMDIMSNQKEGVFTKKMVERFIYNTKEYTDQKAFIPSVKKLLADGIKLKDMTNQEASWFLRSFYEVNMDETPDVRLPSGQLTGKKSSDGRASFSGYDVIEKGVSVIRNGAIENISVQLGEANKVRNFYINIARPTDENAVTIDTHAVGAALGLPVASNSTEVNFSAGFYAFYADAYREAAASIKGDKVTTRELQSITWEAIRVMFPKEEKQHKDNKLDIRVREIWAEHQKGNATTDEVWAEIFTKENENGTKESRNPNETTWATDIEAIHDAGARANIFQPMVGKVQSGDTVGLSADTGLDNSVSELGGGDIGSGVISHVEKNNIIGSVAYVIGGEVKKQKDIRTVSDTESPKFKKWFKDSKAVGEDGKPIVLFHGSNSKFTTFNKKTVKYVGNSGDGFYFSPDEYESQKYAQGDLGSVEEYYLSMQNPLTNDTNLLTEDDYKKLLDEIYSNEELRDDIQNYGRFENKSEYLKLRDKLAKDFAGKTDFAGLFDITIGMIGSIQEVIRMLNKATGNTLDGVWNTHMREYVVFEPNQIKSIYNEGEWSSQNEDTRKQKDIRKTNTVLAEVADSSYDPKTNLNNIMQVGRRAGFTNAHMRLYLRSLMSKVINSSGEEVRVRLFSNKAIDEALISYVGTGQVLPPSFTNIAGGATQGIKLWDRVTTQLAEWSTSISKDNLTKKSDRLQERMLEKEQASDAIAELEEQLAVEEKKKKGSGEAGGESKEMVTRKITSIKKKITIAKKKLTSLESTAKAIIDKKLKTSTKSFAEIRQKGLEILSNDPTFKYTDPTKGIEDEARLAEAVSEEARKEIKKELASNAQSKSMQIAMQFEFDRSLSILENASVSRKMATIKSQLKGMTIGAKELKAIQRDLRLIIRQAMPLESHFAGMHEAAKKKAMKKMAAHLRGDLYKASELNSILRRVSEATEATILVEVEAIQATIDRVRKRQRIKKLAQLKKLIDARAKSKISLSNRLTNGGILPEAADFFNHAKKILSLVISGDVVELEKIADDLAKNEHHVWNGSNSLSSNKQLRGEELKYIAMYDAWHTLARVINLDSSLEDVIDTLEWFKQESSTALAKFAETRILEAEKIEAQKIEADKSVEASFSDMVFRGGLDLNRVRSRGLKQALIKKAEAIGEFAFWVKSMGENQGFIVKQGGEVVVGTADEMNIGDHMLFPRIGEDGKTLLGYDARVADKGIVTTDDISQRKKDRIRLLKNLKFGKFIKETVVDWARDPINMAKLMKSFQNIKTMTNALDIKGTYFVDNIYRPINRAYERFAKAKHKNYAILEAILQSQTINGKKVKTLVQLETMTRKKHTIKIYPHTENKMKSRYPKDSTLSVAELMRVYALSLNETQRQKLNVTGFGEAQMREVESILGEDLMSYVDKVVSFLSTEHYMEVNEVYKEVNNVNLPWIENYFPTISESAQRDVQNNLTGEHFGRNFNAQYQTALKNRIDVTSEVVNTEVDFFGALTTHIDDMAHFTGYAMAVQKLQRLFRVQSVLKMLEVTGMGSMLRQQINFSVNPKARKVLVPSKFYNKAQSRLTMVVLGYKLMQIVKQSTSFVNAFEQYHAFGKPKSKLLQIPMTAVDILGFALESSLMAMKLASPFGQSEIKKMRELSGTFNERYIQGFKGDMYQLASGTDAIVPVSKSKLARFHKKASAFPTILGDVLGVMGYAVAYNADIRNGMSQADAVEKFNNYNETQQSRRTQDMSSIQVNQNFMMRTMMMFMSTFMLQLNKVMQNLTNLGRSRFTSVADYRSLMLNLGMANVFFTLAANVFKVAFGDDEDKLEVLAEMEKSMVGVRVLAVAPYLGIEAEKVIDNYQDEDSNWIMLQQQKVNWFKHSGVDPFAAITREMQKWVKYGNDDDNYERMVDARGNTIYEAMQMVLGVNADPFVGLINLAQEDGETTIGDYTVGGLGGDQFNNVMDVLGVSESYKPSKGEREQEAKESEVTTITELRGILRAMKSNRAVYSAREIRNLEVEINRMENLPDSVIKREKAAENRATKKKEYEEKAKTYKPAPQKWGTGGKTLKTWGSKD